MRCPSCGTKTTPQRVVLEEKKIRTILADAKPQVGEEVTQDIVHGGALYLSPPQGREGMSWCPDCEDWVEE